MALLCSEAEKSSFVRCERVEVSSSDVCQNLEKLPLLWDLKKQELLSGSQMLLRSLFVCSEASKWLLDAWVPPSSFLQSEICKS